MERLRIDNPAPDSREAQPERGRPRSVRVDLAIVEATLEELASSGWAGLTMEGIAGRARVGKAALYRRWKSREAVLAAAVGAMVSEIRIPDTGTIHGDLRMLMEQAVELYRGRAGRLMPGLVAAMAEHEEVATAVRQGFLAERRRALTVVLERAIGRGELREGTDTELALDFLGGPLFYRLLITGGPLDDALAAGTVEVMLKGLEKGER